MINKADFTSDGIVLQTADISYGVHMLAQQIRSHVEKPCFWIIMNGAWMFSTDLIRLVPRTVSVEFLHIRRGYSDGSPHEPFLQGEYPFFKPDYQHVLVDIISEAGNTFQYAHSLIPKDIERYTCALVYKDYAPNFKFWHKEDNLFYTGYGMGPYRELPYIYGMPRD